MSTITNETNWVEAIGKPAFDAIEEMVEAVEVDWDRLEELRVDRRDWDPYESDCKTYEECEPDEAEELRELEEAAGDCEDEDDARQRIQDDPLSVEVGGMWFPGDEHPDPTNYQILLTTGGPAVRIVGDLGEHGSAANARLEVQDWGKSWTEYPCRQAVLLLYVEHMYFGE